MHWRDEASISDYAHHGEDAKYYWYQENHGPNDPADYDPFDDDEYDFYDGDDY